MCPGFGRVGGHFKSVFPPEIAWSQNDFQVLLEGTGEHIHVSYDWLLIHILFSWHSSVYSRGAFLQLRARERDVWAMQNDVRHQLTFIWLSHLCLSL